MPITISEGGGFTITGKTAINLYRLTVITSGLRFEIRTNGMKLTRGPSCYSIAKREFGFKGNKEKVLAQLEAYLATQQASVTRIDERS